MLPAIIHLGRHNPVFFANYFLGLDLNPFQKRYLLGTLNSKQNLVVTGNQVGKTVALAILHIWWNYYKIGISGDPNVVSKAYIRTLNISPVSRQSKEAFRYIEEILHSQFTWEKDGKRYVNRCKIEGFMKGKNENLGRIDFANNTSVFCLSTKEDKGAALQGAQFPLITYDECVQCYAEDTEVLTQKGWKKFNEVNVGDKVPSLNLQTGMVEMANVKKVIWEDYSGKMIQFGGKKCKVNLLVTPNHKMVVKRSLGANKYGDPEFVIAENLIGKHFQLIQEFNQKGKTKDFWIIPAYSNGVNYKRARRKLPINDFLLFLGFYISEGSCWKSRIQIAQTRNGKAYNAIENVLKRLGLNYKYKNNQFLIFDKQLTEYIRRFVSGKSYEKRIPRSVLDLDKKHLRYLFKAMMLGDGTGGRVYGTSSKNLADDFSELCLKLGYIPTIKEYDNRGFSKLLHGREITTRHKFYIVSIRFGEKFPRINHHENSRWASVKEVNYSGKIGCLTLDRNHTLFVRRNGRVCWSGNSYHLADELPARIFSRVAKYNGRVDLISTPDEQAHSQQYWYHLYSEAEKGESDWKLFIGVYDENIFIPEEDREEYKRRLKKLSPERYEQVVFGKFVVSEASVFTPEMIESLWNGRREPTPPKPDHSYVISIDWGVSDQGDETVMLVADDTDPDNAEIVHAYYKRGGDPADLIAMAAYLKDEYNDAKIIMDVASMGGAIFRKRMRKMQPLSFPTDQKGVAIAYAKMRLRNNLRKNPLTQKDESGNGKIKSYYLHKLESQLASYRIDDKKLKQDWVMAFVQLCWYLEEYRTKKKISVYPLRYFNEHKSID